VSDDVTFITNAGRRSSAPLVGARVVVAEGPDAPLEAAVPPKGLTVGQGQGCGLKLTDERVSREHLHVLVTSDGFHVRDLGSRNGTWLSGARVDDAVAPPGSALKLGHTVLKLVGAQEYQRVPASAKTAFGELYGKSVAMREVFGVLERISGSHAAVLVEGPSGTGKELVARSLHALGPRPRGPLVALDCGAIPATLAESELFGHERGAFTGAVDARKGAFERAHGGTLFLDEIGELPLELQPKLLRALEAREVRRVGADEPKKVDVRVVAATHRDLEEMVAEKTFRADLYYRLAVVRVVLPALRERLEDLPMLVAHLLSKLGLEQPGPIAGRNLELLSGHAWDGNVRELRNVLERAVACAGSATPKFDDLPIHLGRAAKRSAAGGAWTLDTPFLEAKERVVDGFERAYLEALLQAHQGNVAEAARASQLNRRHLYDLLKKHGLKA
jgi:DNA-binding NtrC family response regulator